MVVEWCGVGEFCEGSSDGQAPILLSCLETKRFCRTGCRHKSARFQRHPFIIPANDNVRTKDRLSARYGSLLRRLIVLPSTRTMTNVVRSSFQAASHELIAKLVKAGYLRPALCNDADAVTAAIAQLKQDLRAGVTAAPPDADHSDFSGLEDTPIHVPSRPDDVGDHALAGSEGAKSTLAEAAKISANPTMSATLSNSPVTRAYLKIV
jgi:hypothetical protein